VHVALFGGSFNPPHIAHQLACLYVLSTEPVDQVWLVPCFRHVFGKVLAPFEDRFEMCRRLAAPLGQAVQVSAIEQELGGESKTLRTVRALEALHPATRFSLVLGDDVLAETPRWYRWDELRAAVGLIALGRQWAGGAGAVGPMVGEPGLPRLHLPQVSSSAIRAAIAQGQDTSAWVPLSVRHWIEQRGLYGAPAGG
jgi:nicotinate-nucleotide adenylyltransferase